MHQSLTNRDQKVLNRGTSGLLVISPLPSLGRDLRKEEFEVGTSQAFCDGPVSVHMLDSGHEMSADVGWLPPVKTMAQNLLPLPHFQEWLWAF